MKFDVIDEKYLEAASELSQMAYDREQAKVSCLNKKDYRLKIMKELKDVFSSRCGAVAIQEGKLVGYMAFWGGLRNQFGNVLGSYSPLFANAFTGENREKLVSQLFQRASEQMVDRGILSYALTVYGHDMDVLRALSFSGFGYRCSDGIRFVNEPLGIELNNSYRYEEISYESAAFLLPFKKKLDAHMGQSPVYFPKAEMSEGDFMSLCIERRSRFFIAWERQRMIGYLELTGSGETFITEDEDYVHVVGAFVDPQYRGQNVLQSLLAIALEKLEAEGVLRVGVDYETINPVAMRFWEKYFTPYTFSMVRRLDERILGK